MRRYEISDERWKKIKDKLPCQPGCQGKQADNRLFVNAVMFIAKCGIPLRNLPERFGNSNSVYMRFRRWAKKGVWQKVFKGMADKEATTLLINSTALRAHQHAAGALKKQGRKQQTG